MVSGTTRVLDLAIWVRMQQQLLQSHIPGFVEKIITSSFPQNISVLLYQVEAFHPATVRRAMVAVVGEVTVAAAVGMEEDHRHTGGENNALVCFFVDLLFESFLTVT